MTLLRATLLSLLAFASTLALAADPKLDSAAGGDSSARANTQLRSNLDLPHLVPWFTGMTHVNQDLKSAPKPAIHAYRVLSTSGALKGVSCLKLRTYKVRGQETLSDNESAFVSYSTCQWVTNYQVRSAVQTVQKPSH